MSIIFWFIVLIAVILAIRYIVKNWNSANIVDKKDKIDITNKLSKDYKDVKISRFKKSKTRLKNIKDA